MGEALKLARAAELAGEVPIGAVVVSPEGDMVGRGYNRTILDVDPSAHAEIVALREAAWKLGNHRLPGCTLYVTIEPCPMCRGAMVQARLARAVYGAPSTAGHPVDNHSFILEAGVLAEACGDLVRDFFLRRR